MSSSYVVSTTRLQALQAHWRSASSPPFGALVCVAGTNEDSTVENQRGQALLRYLLQAEENVANVALVLTPNEALFVHSPHNAVVASNSASSSEAVKVEGESMKSPACVLPFASAGADVRALLTTAKKEKEEGNEEKGAAASGSGGDKVGATIRELGLQTGADFALPFISLMKEACGDRLVEASPFIGELLFIKDARAIGYVGAAAQCAMRLLTHVVRPDVETAIARKAKEGPASVPELRAKLCAALADPTAAGGAEGVEAARGVTPCLFSYDAATAAGAEGTSTTTASPVKKGGGYMTDIQAAEEALPTGPLRPGVITVRYGVKKDGYTALIARTLVVQPDAPAGAVPAYDFLYRVSERLMALCVPGAVLREVYAAALAHAREIDARLAARLAPSFGFSTGLLVAEKRNSISADGTAVLADGAALVLRVCLTAASAGDNTNTNDAAADDDDGIYMELSDTIAIQEGKAVLLTRKSREPAEVTLYRSSPGAGDKEGDDENEEEEEEEGGGGGRRRPARDLTAITRATVSKEFQRQEKLKELLKELDAELRAAGGKKASSAGAAEELKLTTIGRLAAGEVKVDPAVLQQPPPAAATRLVVDEAKKLLWAPIFPHNNNSNDSNTKEPQVACFHIATVDKVIVKSEGSGVFSCTVTFQHLQERNPSYLLHRTKAFVKELRYEAPTAEAFHAVEAAVKATQARIKSEDAARRQQAQHAGSARLTLVPNPTRLENLRIRPPLAAARQAKVSSGNLEIHGNGLRYNSLGSAPVEMLFDNIRHTIFQPSSPNSGLTILHVTLKKPIEVGKKTTTEVQFLAEVLDTSAAVTAGRREHELEVAEEEAMRQRLKRTNLQFMTFTKRVNEARQARTHVTLGLHFDGVHAKGQVEFQGDTQVLWAVADWPPLTLALEEVEVVAFERVFPGFKNFDVTFVKKDYRADVVRVTTVDASQLDALKDWCLAARLYYIIFTTNPNWRATLKEAAASEDWNPWDAHEGWPLMNDEEGSSGEEEETDSDETASFSEEDEESSDDDSSWLEDEESSDGDDSGDDDDDEEDEESDDDEDTDDDWDKMEREAAAEDRRHGAKRPRAPSAHTGATKASGGGGGGQRGPAPPPAQLPRTKGPVGYGSAPPPARRF